MDKLCFLVVVTRILFIVVAKNSETCGRLEILRGYSGLGDGTYTKIADVCETTSAYPIYEQSDIGLYLYRLTDGTWAMYDRTCSLDHYGSTTKVSPYPWTLVFDTEEVTAITCTDYRRVYDHPVTAIEGHITLPSMYVGNDDVRDATYNVSAVLPITTETLEYTVHVSGRCTSGTLQVYQVIDGDSEVVGTMPAICDSTSPSSKRLVFNNTQVTENVFAISANIHLASSADLQVNVSYSVSYIGDDEDITTSVTEGHTAPMVGDKTTVAVSTEDNDFPASTEEALLTWTNGTSGVPVYTSDKDLTTSSPEIDKDEHTVDTTSGLPYLDVTSADTRTTLDLTLLSTDSDGYTSMYTPVCEQGQYLDPAILKCFSCPAGSYQLDPLATKCAPCPAGQYQPSQGQAYCLTCPSGFYQPDEEQTACIPCPVGTYQPLTGRGECMQCPSQKTTRAEGSVSQQYCNVFYCLSGFEESPVEIGQCRPCGYNTYKNNSEDPFGECTACSPGLITLEKMATSRDQCVPDPCPSVRCEFGATCVRGGCQCPPSCPHIMKPVCGSDGESYTSRCDLEARVCHLRKPITVQHTGRCEDDPCSEVTCSCGQACIKGQCRCPDDDTPVCANDSKTYPSECHMLSVACATHTPLRLRYRVPCENLTRLPDIAGVITDNNPPIRGLYLVLIFVSFFVVIATTLAIIAAVLLVRRRRKRKPKEEKVPMINAATRTFSASSQNQRITVEKRPESPQQVDRLSGCITPLDEHPGFRFDNVITNNENPQRHLSSTDTSVPELNLNQSPSVVAGLDGPIRTSCLMAGPEVMPTKPRLPSVVDNGVTEKQPESTTVLDMDDVFQDDEPATKTVRFNTRL